MEAFTKKFLNSLRCPICSGQIDVVRWDKNRFCDFGCVYDTDHYKIKLNNGFLAQETVSIYDKDHKYSLVKKYDYNQVFEEIWIYEADQEQRVQFSFAEKRISTEVELFDFKNFNIEKALKRIKTYLIFR